MYRVVLPAFLSFALGACSLGSSSLFSSESGTSDLTSTGSTTKVRGSTVGLGGEPATSRSSQKAPPGGKQQTAALDTGATADRAPKGSYDTAPSGALADRDYGQTNLQADAARDLINAYRKQHGLKPVALNAELTTAAKAHARDLAKWDRISHYGSDGSNPWDRVKRAGYNARVAAENVGTGQVSVDEVFKGWQESPGHNKNLLMPDVEHIGIALVQEPKTEFKTFWVLAFGARL